MVTPLAVTPYIVGHLATSSAVTSVVVPVTSAPALNDTMVAIISSAAAGGVFSGTTDSKGNSWTTFASSTSNRPLYFAWAINTKGLTTSDSITFPLSPSGNARITVVGFLGPWRPDKTPAGNGGSASSMSASTGTLSVSGELCIGGCSQSGTTLPNSQTWTLIENFSTGTIISSAYTNAASTASQTYTVTTTATPFYDVGVVTFQPGAVLSVAGSAPAVSSASGAFGASVINGVSNNASSAGGAFLPGAVFVLPSAGSTENIWVEILDSNLVSQGPVQFASINAQLYYNAVGAWTVVVPYSDSLWNIMMSGDFLVNVNWRGLFSFGGKCEQPAYSDSIPGAGSGAVVGPFITLTGADYLALIANRICYPSPGAAWVAQTAGASDPVSGIPLETAIKHYVLNNIGSSAISGRRHTLLDVAASSGRGSNVTYTVKFASGVDLNMMDVIRALIAQAGSGNAMGVKITRNPNTHRLLFDVYIPRDLTGKAWFSGQLGNLTAVQFSLTDPTCTDSLVQGSGTTFIQKTASGRTQWNAVEQFSDSSSETDLNNLNTTAQDALLTGAAGPTMSVTATDIPFLTFGRDYGLGDIVSVEVRPGAVYSDVVTGVTLTADPSQSPEITVVPTIGNNANATATDQSIIGQLSARIRALEKKLATQ